MNGNFRKPEFVKRYEYIYYDLETPLNSNVGNAERQIKNNYRFEVDNSSEANPIDWYNAYLEVDFKLVTLANSAVGFTVATDAANSCTTTNGQTFVKEVQVECNGIRVYNNNRANESTNILSMLKYTKSYADTVGQDQFFFVDSSTGAAQPNPATVATYNEGFAQRKKLTDAININSISIPLNLYSYFAAFKNNLHPNLKLNLKLTLENDDNIIFKQGADDATAPAKVIITKLRLWLPKIIFNEVGLKAYLAEYLKPKTWTYLKEHQEIKQSGQATNGAFRISTGIRRPRHVFIWAVQTDAYGDQQKNIFTFGLNNVGTDQNYARAQLEINNSIFYPQLEFSSTEESRLYRALMSFSAAYNDVLSGPIIDRTNFRNLFGILYFDRRNQRDDVKDSVVSLTFRYQLGGASAENYTLNALILHEKEIELYTSSGKLLIKA